jgi:hypothetical protein
MNFLIDIEFTKILGWFKQKQLVDLFMTWNFKLLISLINIK